MSADITLVNLNMLFMRYGEEIERELHVPLGPLYLTRALEDAGFAVDFRDYQIVDSDEPFDMSVFLDFVKDPAPVIGLSCMANLLPFSILAIRALREKYPDRTLILGGVGSKAVEEKILNRFPWIDIICRGEGERTVPELMQEIPLWIGHRSHAGPEPHHRSGQHPLSRVRKGRPVALRGLRHDDQPRLPLPVYLLLGRPGVGLEELLPQPEEYRRRNGVPAPRGGRGPVPVSG